jgi:hypothetical protein
MSARPLGTNTSGPEVTNVSSHGLWLLAGEKELFLSYEDFPWFKDVPIRKILNVQEPTPGRFYPDVSTGRISTSIWASKLLNTQTGFPSRRNDG